MKRRPYLSKDKAPTLDEPTLDISSLIDVCFLLLIYFLITTTIQPREQDLSTYVPTLSDNPVTITPMMIEIRQSGEVVVNPGDAAETYDSDVSNRKLPELDSRLRMLAAWAPAGSPNVLLKVHDEVDQQRYIDVVNCLAGVGIKSVALLD